jgi:hypothetical protein
VGTLPGWLLVQQGTGLPEIVKNTFDVNHYENVAIKIMFNQFNRVRPKEVCNRPSHDPYVNHAHMAAKVGGGGSQLKRKLKDDITEAEKRYGPLFTRKWYTESFFRYQSPTEF